MCTYLPQSPVPQLPRPDWEFQAGLEPLGSEALLSRHVESHCLPHTLNDAATELRSSPGTPPLPTWAVTTPGPSSAAIQLLPGLSPSSAALTDPAMGMGSGASCLPCQQFSLITCLKYVTGRLRSFSTRSWGSGGERESAFH